MSSSLRKNTLSQHQWVLVRAFGDNPVPLRYVSQDSRTVVVSGERDEDVIGFPRAFVFDYNESLFEQMRRAYEDGDKTRLTVLWEQARLFTTRMSNSN